MCPETHGLGRYYQLRMSIVRRGKERERGHTVARCLVGIVDRDGSRLGRRQCFK